MPWERKPIIFVASTIAILEIITGILTNVATNILPDSWKSSLWICWPLLGVCYFTIFGLKKWTGHMARSNDKINTSPHAQMQEAPISGKGRQQATSSYSNFKTHGVKPFQFQSISPAISGQDHQTLPPLLLDDLDNTESKVAHKPLPAKPVRVARLSARGKIASLQKMKLEVHRILDLPEKPTTLRWSPDGTYIICVFHEHVPLLISENERIELPIKENVQAICWSPDSQKLAISAQGEIHLWNITTGFERSLSQQLSTRSIYGLDWSIRGQLAVWIDNQIQIFTHPDFTSPQILPTQNLLCKEAGLLRWSPNGFLLAAGATNNGGSLTCWHVDAQVSQSPLSQSRVLSLTWIPESSLLAAAFSNKLMIWDAHQRRETKTVNDFPVAAHTLSISREGHMVIASIGDNLLFGKLDEEIFPSSRYPGHWIAAWSPTGSDLATLDAEEETSLIILKSVN